MEREYNEIVELLINKGIDMNVKSRFDETALHKGLYKIK
jgi:ankyrin repeat protein